MINLLLPIAYLKPSYLTLNGGNTLELLLLSHDFSFNAKNIGTLYLVKVFV